MERLTIIGHFGGDNHFNDGQTVKTTNLYNELVESTEWKIKKVDTYLNKTNPIKLFLEFIKAILSSKDTIVLLSTNGLKIFLPLLYFSKKLVGIRVYHDVIGGNLAQQIKQNPRYIKYLNSFEVNWVETKLLAEELKNCGISNIEIIPNFRRFSKNIQEKTDVLWEEPYKFCTFSRVIREKGIREAIVAVEQVNNSVAKQICTLDIYGPIDSDFEIEFDNLIKTASKAITYKGEVNSSEAVTKISKYYCTIFPTYWLGEGSAGTVIESLNAGVPIIATDWRCNSEMIKDGETGLVYPGKKVEKLNEAILWMINQKGKRNEMSKKCLKEGQYYWPDQHIEKIIRFIRKAKKK